MKISRRASLAAMVAGGVSKGSLATVNTAADPGTAAGRDPSLTRRGGPGPVMPLGGGVRFDNPVVWPKVVELAGGRGARVAVLSMASGQAERVAQTVGRVLERHGAVSEWVAVAPTLPGIDLPAAVRDPKWIDLIERCDAMFFTGGAQARIVDTLAPQGQASPLLQAIRRRHARGALVAGTSAGAAIMSHVMFRDAPFVTSVLKGQLRAGREYDRGLGFVDPGLFIDQHFLKRGRIGRMIPMMVAQNLRLGLGVEEDSAVLIEGQILTMVGGRGCLVVDLHDANSQMVQGALSLTNARLHLLDSGDRFDMATRTLTPHPAKLNFPVTFRERNFDPSFEFDRYFMDILGDYAIADAMIQLVDGPRGQVRGLAHSRLHRPGDDKPDLGFEFILRRDEHTQAWSPLGVGTGVYCIHSVRLDIAPVRMASPLFTPWAGT